MRIKLFILIISIPAILLFTNSCQKDDTSDNTKKANICPEVAMNNFDEAGMIINDFLVNLKGNTESENLEKLDHYFNKCDCVQSVNKSSELISTYPRIKEYSIRFVFDSDTISRNLEIMVFEDGKLEFRKFQK